MAFLKAKSNKYHIMHLRARCHVNKYFHLVKVGDVDRSKNFECETMKGILKLHQVRFVSHKDPTICQFQHLSCLCMACVDCSPKFVCVHKYHVPEWTLMKLRPKNPLQVKEMMYDSDEKIEAGIGGEWIANNLHLSDNVLVPTPTNKPFWLMLVDKGVHTILESFEDGDKNEWTT